MELENRIPDDQEENSSNHPGQSQQEAENQEGKSTESEEENAGESLEEKAEAAEAVDAKVSEELDSSPQVIANEEKTASVEEKDNEEVAGTDEATQRDEAAPAGDIDEDKEKGQSTENQEVTIGSGSLPMASGEESETQADVDENDENEEDEEPIDYEHLEKAELVALIAELSKEDDPKKYDFHLKPLKFRYDFLIDQEKSKALEKFLAEGNDEEDFEFRIDEEFTKFHDYFEILRDKKSKFYSDLEKRKQDNLLKKEEILTKIRELIDSEESDASIKAVRDLQEAWKSVGPVPGQHNKTLWANYNALLDRFYDARSIYFELKDLDRKKNLDLKIDICQRAEHLDQLEDVKEAVIQLNELHEEFKHVGPIPRDQQEEIWTRFKAASDKIYVKRKDFVDTLKKSFDDNLEKKRALIEELKDFQNFESDRISNWNKKTKDIQELQRRWEAIGGVPRQQAKEINRAFWSSFKQFFAKKSAFFKHLESQRDQNMDKKKALIEEAKSMQESSDWNKTTDAYKKLQAQWKEIGPVPEKFRNSIYEEFKKACDHFFERRRSQNQEQDKAFEENYSRKCAICDELLNLSKADSVNLEQINDLIDEFNDIGFVPRNVIKKIRGRFQEATAAIFSSDKISEDDKQDLKINMDVGKLRGGPHADKKMFRKENSLKRKIDNLESNINTWKTNMQFFAASKAADELKKDFEEKIEKADQELRDLRKELRMLNN